MNHKRSRTPAEKIKDALERVNNLHPTLYQELYDELINLSEYNNNVGKCKNYVTKKLNIPEQGKYTKEYWLARGWSELETILKKKQNKPIERKSVYSREYWFEKINPNTGNLYTAEEADFERNSRRPIRKEYWIIQGFSEEEAKKLAENKKSENNKKGSNSKTELSNRIGSHKCIEYWIVRGFSEEESLELIKSIDTAFSLKKCISKYGQEEGYEKWLERQNNWQHALKNKSEEEIEIINRKKATKINYRTLWNKELDLPGIMYIIKIFNDKELFYKVGITSRTVADRFYDLEKIGYEYEIISIMEGTISNCFELEQKVIKQNRSIKYTPIHKIAGWTECFKNEPFVES